MDVYSKDSSSQPSEVSQLITMVMQLKEDMNMMKDNQTKMMATLETMSANATTEKELRLKAEAELKQMKDKETPMNPTAPPTPPKPTLLIGTSLLRNVDSKALDNVEVNAKGGATLTDLLTTLNRLPEGKSYANIVLVGGSVDLEKNTSEEIVTNFEATMVTASQHTDKTTVCGIPPRTDKD